MVAERAEIALFDCVLAEAISVLTRRVAEKRRTADIGDLLSNIQSHYPIEDVLWVFPDVPGLYNEILELIRSTKGELNFNDALIALSCRNRNLPLLASFDRDFGRIGWLRRIGDPASLGN